MQNTFETLALTALWNGVVETTTNENSLLTADKLLRENKSKIEAFWHIGRFIVMNEQGGKVTARYGEETIVSVSKYLTWKYGRGFSARNIAYMKRLFVYFPILQAAINTRLTWSQYTEILNAETPEEVVFYKTQAEKNCWSLREIRRQVRGLMYYRLRLRGHENLTVPATPASVNASTWYKLIFIQ